MQLRPTNLVATCTTAHLREDPLELRHVDGGGQRAHAHARQRELPRGLEAEHAARLEQQARARIEVTQPERVEGHVGVRATIRGRCLREGASGCLRELFRRRRGHACCARNRDAGLNWRLQVIGRSSAPETSGNGGEHGQRGHHGKRQAASDERGQSARAPDGRHGSHAHGVNSACLQPGVD